ncbi:MAG: anti-sigma factor antagonist [Acidimicrobiaceae bacterium]|nr:anti-sigma factor antagonist [Acidimicrobiaceae bacterium]
MENTDGFSLNVARGGDGSVVAQLAGELDLSCAAAARERIFDAIEPGGTLVLDLRSLEFMDSSGLGVLIASLAKAREAGGRLIVANPSNRVYRLIETSRLGDLFAITRPAEYTGKGDEVARGHHPRLPRDRAALEELRTLLLGYENLLRWGDLTPQQVTVALRGEALADATSDLALAGRVREMLVRLGADPPRPPPSED